jgi:hypothetical protein
MKRTYSSVSKILAGLIYLGFFLVQFNIRFTGHSSTESYFSSGYNSVSCDQHAGYANLLSPHKSHHHGGFKLNKRFHPEKLFVAPVQTSGPIPLIYFERDLFAHEENPGVTFTCCVTPLRGPPAFV